MSSDWQRRRTARRAGFEPGRDRVGDGQERETVAVRGDKAPPAHLLRAADARSGPLQGETGDHLERRARGELAQVTLQVVARREAADVEAGDRTRASTRRARSNSRAERPPGSGYFCPPWAGSSTSTSSDR